MRRTMRRTKRTRRSRMRSRSRRTRRRRKWGQEGGLIMRKKNWLFKIIPFLLLRIRFRTLKSDPDPDPVKSRPNPQHWTVGTVTGVNLNCRLCEWCRSQWSPWTCMAHATAPAPDHLLQQQQQQRGSHDRAKAQCRVQRWDDGWDGSYTIRIRPLVFTEDCHQKERLFW